MLTMKCYLSMTINMNPLSALSSANYCAVFYEIKFRLSLSFGISIVSILAVKLLPFTVRVIYTIK